MRTRCDHVGGHSEVTVQAERLLKLLSLLQSGRLLTGERLAGALGVSPRTLRRDIESLTHLGYAIDSVPGRYGGYQLRHGETIPPLLWDEQQVTAICLALQTWDSGTEGMDDAAARALASLLTVVPRRLLTRAQMVRASATTAADVVPADTVDALLRCIDRREEVVLAYRKATSPHEERRTVQPHTLVKRGARWYLVGWESAKADWRTFRLDRVRVVTSGRRFVPREPAVLPQDLVPGRPVPLPCRGTARILAPPQHVEPWVGEEAAFSVDEDGACRVTASSWTWVGLVAWFALFDAPLELVSPPELVGAGRELAARLERAVPGARPGAGAGSGDPIGRHGNASDLLRV